MVAPFRAFLPVEALDQVELKVAAAATNCDLPHPALKQLKERPGTASKSGKLVLPAAFRSIPVMMGLTGLELIIEEFTLTLKPHGALTTPAMFKLRRARVGP